MPAKNVVECGGTLLTWTRDQDRDILRACRSTGIRAKTYHSLARSFPDKSAAQVGQVTGPPRHMCLSDPKVIRILVFMIDHPVAASAPYCIRISKLDLSSSQVTSRWRIDSPRWCSWWRKPRRTRSGGQLTKQAVFWRRKLPDLLRKRNSSRRQSRDLGWEIQYRTFQGLHPRMDREIGLLGLTI